MELKSKRVECKKSTTIVVQACCHNSDKENNNKHRQDETNMNQSKKAINDMEKPFETNNNNNMSNTLVTIKTREDIVLPKIVDSSIELDKKVKRELSSELKEKLPKLACPQQQQQQQQQQQKSKKHRIKSTCTPKTNADFKINNKVSQNTIFL